MRLSPKKVSPFFNSPCESNNSAYSKPAPAFAWNKFFIALLGLLIVSCFFILFMAPVHAEGDAAATQAAAVPTDTPPAYVGADKCKMCHMDRFKTWSTTGMSKAWDRIKDATDKEKCLACHTTGYGRPGGFRSVEATPNLTSVQCEVCHGPGGAHVALPISQKDPAIRRSTINKFIQDCRACHSPHVPDKAAAARGGSGS